MTDFESAARAAVQITRAAPLFDQLVDVLLSHAALAAHSANSADGVAHQAELRVIRDQLDAHYPEFQRLYFELLRKHLGGHLPAVLAALSDEHVQTYFKAQKAMEHELISELDQLADKMASGLTTKPWRESAAASLKGTLPLGITNPQGEST